MWLKGKYATTFSDYDGESLLAISKEDLKNEYELGKDAACLYTMLHPQGEYRNV
jgi:hypothetical protein